jgi:hypothetical protein
MFMRTAWSSSVTSPRIFVSVGTLHVTRHLNFGYSCSKGNEMRSDRDYPPSCALPVLGSSTAEGGQGTRPSRSWSSPRDPDTAYRESLSLGC